MEYRTDKRQSSLHTSRVGLYKVILSMGQTSQIKHLGNTVLNLSLGDSIELSMILQSFVCCEVLI